jgi:hypothetical protein
MGLNTSYFHFIESSIKQVFGEDVRGLSILELGDQIIRDPNITEKTGKDYFTNRGYEHVSVDINGLYGAVIRDLTRPEQFHDWHDSWDILTNSGTTEHVEPFESQYECFSIIHDCIKVGGIAVHLIPDVYERDEHNAWKNHCRYYYSESFFELLAKECKYELLSNTVIDGLRCATVKKTTNGPFMEDRSKFLESIAQRDYQTDNSKNVVRTALRRIGVEKLLRRLDLS